MDLTFQFLHMELTENVIIVESYSLDFGASRSSPCIVK